MPWRTNARASSDLVVTSNRTVPMLDSISSFGAEASVVNVGTTEGLAQAIDSDQLVVVVPVRSISMDDVRALAEELEQLRALENGHRIRAAEVEGWTSVPVDVPEDVPIVEAALARASNTQSGRT